MNPPERRAVGVCTQCADPILEGEAYYDGAEGTVHADCMKDYLEERLGVELVAEMFGYRKIVAGEWGEAVS